MFPKGTCLLVNVCWQNMCWHTLLANTANKAGASIVFNMMSVTSNLQSGRKWRNRSKVIDMWMREDVKVVPETTFLVSFWHSPFSCTPVWLVLAVSSKYGWLLANQPCRKQSRNARELSVQSRIICQLLAGRMVEKIFQLLCRSRMIALS